MNQTAESLFGSRWSTTSVVFVRFLSQTIAGLSVAILLICISGIVAYAQEQPPPPAGEGIPDQLKTYTVKNYTDWLKQYQDAKPDFKPGDTLTQKDIGKLQTRVDKSDQALGVVIQLARPGGANVECNGVCYLPSSSKPVAWKCEPARKCDLHCAINPPVGGCN